MRRKEPSNHTGSPIRRFTLPKSHILRGRQKFNRLFSESTLLKSSTVNLRYAAYPNQENKMLAGFVAPKRLGKAVERSRLKRLLREAYRLNQHILDGLPEELNAELHFLFLARHTNVDFERIQKDMVTLLHEMRNRLLPNTSFY